MNKVIAVADPTPHTLREWAKSKRSEGDTYLAALLANAANKLEVQSAYIEDLERGFERMDQQYFHTIIRSARHHEPEVGIRGAETDFELSSAIALAVEDDLNWLRGEE